MAATYELLLNASFRFISYRPRSEKEIKDFLVKKLKAWNIAADFTVDKVIIRLREYGYIDDKKFVQWWIEQRSRFKQKGDAYITHELLQKGIPKKTIQEGLALITSTDTQSHTERIRAMNLMKKYLPKLKNLSGRERSQKIYTYLAQRGFASSTIHTFIDEITQNGYNEE
jgi:regulatory protein